MKTKNVARKFLSLVLVLCMVTAYFAVSVSAAEPEKTTFNYVSLGASNTNGYGMRGYITEEELNLMLSGQVSKDDVNVYGYERKPEGAYPDLIRDYYVGIYGEENVNINQLAISSMRVEELRVLLDDSYMGDDYTSWRFTGDDGWFKSAEEGGLPALREAYKNSIQNADLITVDIGWNNFGVYVCNQLVDYLNNGRYKWTTDISTIYETEAEVQAAAQAKAIIGEYIKSNIGEGEMADALTDIFAYSILGYIHNFDIVMEKIYELNPDADVVVLGIQNLLYGVVVEINGEQFPLGDLFGNFVNMANYYSSACSPYQSYYLYAKAGTDEHVTIFLDYMKSYNGDAANLDQNVKDCYDYYDNDLFIQTRVDYMAAALIEEEYGSMLSMVGYESAEDVVVDGKKGNLPTVGSMNLQDTFDSMYWPALNAAYDTLSELVKVIANYPSVDASGLLSGSIDIGAIEDALMKAVEDEVTENAIAAANGEAYTVDIDTMIPDSNTAIVASIYVRFYMGNSFFAHPSNVGHAEIKDAVLNVVNNPSSEIDQPLASYLMESVTQIQQLLCEATNHARNYAASPVGSNEYACSCGLAHMTRLAGSGRCETAIEVADVMKEALGIERFDAIIIANGDNFADALAGSYLAAQKKAPILLYRASAVAKNLEYIQNNLSDDGVVYLLGGTAAVPADVETGLQAAGITCKRLYGNNRFDTNIEILLEAGIEAGQEILIATGYEFADSLSASATGLPILLVNSTTGKLTDTQVEFLESLDNCTFTIIGGTSAVPEDLGNAVGAYGEVTRLAGNSREATSVLVAEAYFENPDRVLLAYSRNFPDGLCGGPLAYVTGAPLILVNAGKEAAAAEYTAANGIVDCTVLGGTSVLSNDTVNASFN